MLVSDEGALRAARAATGAAPRAAAACGSRCPRCPRAPATRATRWIWAENLKPTRPERNDLLLAVSEAATNVVRHAYPARAEDAGFRLGAEISDGRVQVVVTDDGVGLGGSSSDPGLGMGLPLLGTLTDTLMLVGPPERSRGLEVRMWFALASLAARARGSVTVRPSGRIVELVGDVSLRVGPLRLEQEQLDRDVGIGVHLAQVGAHAPAQRRLDDCVN